MTDKQRDNHGNTPAQKTDQQKADPQDHAPQDPSEMDEQQFKTAPPDVRNQEPKNSPELHGSQVAAVNPPSVQTGNRDREQI